MTVFETDNPRLRREAEQRAAALLSHLDARRERLAALAPELLAFVREVAALQSAPAAHEACGFVLDARALVARAEGEE